MEELRVAGMTDDASSVAIPFKESDGHAVGRRRRPEQRGVHQARGFRPQQRRSAPLRLQMGDHEARHVRSGRGQASRRRGAHKLVVERRTRGSSVALRHVRCKPFWQRLPERRALHVEWLENVLVEVVVECLAGDALDDIRRQRQTVVAVRRHFARRKHARRLRLTQVGLDVCERLRIRLHQSAQQFLEPRGVSHEIAQRHRFTERIRNAEIEE